MLHDQDSAETEGEAGTEIEFVVSRLPRLFDSSPGSSSRRGRLAAAGESDFNLLLLPCPTMATLWPRGKPKIDRVEEVDVVSTSPTLGSATCPLIGAVSDVVELMIGQCS